MSDALNLKLWKMACDVSALRRETVIKLQHKLEITP